MIGKQPAKTSPTIIFCSEVDNFRKNAMKLVEKKILLEKYPGILVTQSSKLPRPLPIDDDTIFRRLPNGVYAEAH